MDELAVRILGCGDAFGSGGRFHTCFHVAAAGGAFLVDCGASALIALKKWRVERRAIGTILLTHLHGDHFGGVPFFLLDAHFIAGRRAPLTIAGPPGVEERLGRAMEALFPGSAAIDYAFPIRYRELPAARPVPLDGLTVTAYEVVHPSGAPSYGLRVEVDGRVLAFSGDTGWTDALLPLARGSDLFLCECFAYDTPVPYHLDYATVLARQDELGSRRIVLTHLGEAVLAHLDELELEGVDDGDLLTVTRP